MKGTSYYFVHGTTDNNTLKHGSEFDLFFHMKSEISRGKINIQIQERDLHQYK